MINWTIDDVANLNGRTYVITGGNSGTGLCLAKMLSSKGANVIITCRNATKANEAIKKIKAQYKSANIQFVSMDLSELNSVKIASQQILNLCPIIDGLINNAGVMLSPFMKTVDGYESQFATNFLGHFALTAYLLPAIMASQYGRVVTVSSLAHKSGIIDFDNQFMSNELTYSSWAAYSQSKLAGLLFSAELQRRLTGINSHVISTAAHPGYAATGLQDQVAILRFTNNFIAQTAEQGAMPILFATVSDQAKPGGYYGPQNLMEMRGYLGEARKSSLARNEQVAFKLWLKATEITGVDWPAEMKAIFAPEQNAQAILADRNKTSCTIQ